MEIVDREVELAILRKLLVEAREGRGGVALVRGAVASGKTEFLHRFAEHVTQSGALFLSAAGSRAERTLPLGVIRQLFRSAAPASAAAEGVARLLDDGALAPVLSDCEPEHIGPAAAQVLHGLCVSLLGLAERTPVVIGVDDVQYADTASVQCILYLVRRMRSCRIMIVLNEGGGGDLPFHAELMAQSHCHGITLPPLSRDGVGRVLAARLGPSVPRPFAEAAHRLTGGNPLLVRALADDNSGISPTYGQSGHPAVGDAYGQAVLRCLYRGAPEMLHAARALAVLGQAASPALVAGLLEVEPGDAAQTLGALTAAGLLDRNRFRHSVARTVVLKDIPLEKRVAMHRRSARVLHGEAAAPMVVARHLVASGSLDDAWGIPVLQQAAERAVLDGEPEFAVECLERAREACTDPARRTTLTVLLAHAQWRVNPSAGSGHLPTLRDAVHAGTLTGAHAGLAVSRLLWSGRVADVTEALESAHSRTEDADLPAELSAATPWLLCCHPALLPLLPRPSRPAGSAPALTDSGGHAGHLLTAALRGDADGTVAASAERILRRFALDDRSAESILAALTTLVYLDRPGRAAAWCDTLLGPDAAERLAPTWQALFAAIRAEAAVRRGDLAAADRYACAALTEISPQSWGVAIGAPLSALLAASVDMGRYREAGEQLAQPVPDALLQTTFGLHYLHARGRYALAVDLPHAALADFQACGDLMARWGVTSPAVVPWRTDAAYALLRVGEAREARDLIQRQLRATRDGFPRARGAALRALAQTTDLRQRRNILREAVDVLQTCGDDLELARALADLSRTHYALGESNTARLMLRRAHHLSQECQAEPLRRSLQPSQAEPSGESGLAGVDGDSAQQLSDAERRVAVLAAQGHTNREIARRLYITISTVEQHLTRIYRKLNVNRRADLPTGLQAAPAATAGYPDPASRCGPDLVQSRP